MKKGKLESEIIRKVEAFDSPPSEQVWTNINQKLDDMDIKKTRKNIGRISLAIATVVLLTSFAVFQFRDHSPSSEAYEYTTQLNDTLTEEQIKQAHLFHRNLVQQAKAHGKALLVYVYQNDCTYCEKLTAETLNDYTIQDRLKKHFHLEKINIDDSEAAIYGKAHHIDETPTFVFYNTAYEEMGRLNGYQSASMFSEFLQKMAQSSLHHSDHDPDHPDHGHGRDHEHGHDQDHHQE